MLDNPRVQEVIRKLTDLADPKERGVVSFLLEQVAEKCANEGEFFSKVAKLLEA